MALKPKLGKRLLAVAKWLLFFALGLAIIWFSLRSIPANKWDDFVQSLRTARYWLFGPVLLLLTFSHLIRAYRWQLLMEPLGKKPRLINAFFAVMVGYLANLAVPRLGEVLKCTLLARYEKIPAEQLVGTVVAERAFDVLCLGVVFLMALLFQYDIVLGFVQKALAARNTTPGAGGMGWGMYLLLAVMVLLALGFLFRKRLTATLFQKIKGALTGLQQGLLSAGKLEHKTRFFLSSAAIWTLYIVSTWIGFLAMEGSEHMSLQVACTALAFGSIGMILTPGGIGSYALFVAEALLQNGVAYEVGYANGTLQWFAQFAAVIVVGSLCLFLFPIFNRSVPSTT